MTPVRRAGRGHSRAEARVSSSLSSSVRRLARELRCQRTLRQYRLNWKSVATIVNRAVKYGLKKPVAIAVHVIEIDEVSGRKGQVYLRMVYDLERRVLLWVVDDGTEAAVRLFFTRDSPKKWGRRRCPTLQSSAWICRRPMP